MVWYVLNLSQIIISVQINLWQCISGKGGALVMLDIFKKGAFMKL